MFCLRRYDRVPDLPILLVGYTEQVTAIPFDLNGSLAATLFVKSVHTKNRALKMGWKDETEAYRKQLELQNKEKLKKEIIVDSFTSVEKETKVKRKTRKK